MPTKTQLVSPTRRAGRSAQQGGVAFSVVLLLDYVLGLDMPGEVFGAAVAVLSALGSFVHARIQP